MSDALQTAPLPATEARHPAGLRPLFFAELWERFSYYGMRALLTLFMVAPAVEGGLGLSVAEAAAIYGNYTMAVYMLMILGGFIADAFLGARRAVLIGGSVIAAGHYTLAVPTEFAFFTGLTLIALGTGLFKPCISAMVGGLYAEGDERRDAGFSIFYMGINIGAFIAPLVTGFLAQSPIFKAWLADFGLDPASSWHWGFAAAGVGMTLGLAAFLTRLRDLGDVGAPPEIQPGALRQLGYVAAGTLVLLTLTALSDRPDLQWLRYLFLALPVAAIVWLSQRPGVALRRMAAVFVFFIAAMVFFAIFEQAGLTIALFADKLTRNEAFGFSFPSAWFQSLNPLFVILLAPLFAQMWLRLGARQPASPVKFALGLLLLASSFVLMVPAAHLAAEGRVSPLWLVGLFFLQTMGELLLSPVGLSIMTKIAPERLVALTLGIWFLATAWGNKLAGVLGAQFDAREPGEIARFFLIQAGWVILAAVVLLALTPWIRQLMGRVR